MEAVQPVDALISYLQLDPLQYGTYIECTFYPSST